MEPSTSLRQFIDCGNTAVGVRSALGNMHVAELFAYADLDFVYFDQQHGMTSFDSMVAQLRCTRGAVTAPLVRVAANEPALIGHALDGGAEGVIVPMVETVEAAVRAVAASKYYPVGSRSFGRFRSRPALGASEAEINANVLCLVMVETMAGLDELDRIVDVPGVDGVYVGPGDLALTMGLSPRPGIQAGEHAAAIERISAACARTGKIAGITGDPAEMAALGFRLITAGHDLGFLQAGLEDVRRRRAALPSGQSTS